MQVTTAEVALIGIGATLIGGALGTLLSGKMQAATAERTLASQRRLAEDQRLWGERRSIYLSALSYLNQYSTDRTDYIKAIRAGRLDPDVHADIDSLSDIIDQITVFSSTEIGQLFQQCNEAQYKFLTARHEGKALSSEDLAKKLEIVDDYASGVQTLFNIAVRNQLQGEAVHD